MKSGRELLLLLIAATVLFTVNIGSTREFRCDDEYLYTRIAAEMFYRADPWIPTWCGEPAFYKPPFTYWLMMAGFAAGGTSLVAARLAIVITTILTVLLVYLLGARMYGQREGLIAGLLCATCLGFQIYGRVGMLDMPLTLFTAAAVYCFYRAHREGSRTHAGLFFALAGASSLVKGPISTLILFVFALVFLIAYRKAGAGGSGGWRAFFTLPALAGLLAGIASACTWPLAVWMKGSWNQWFDFFILQENFGKFADSVRYSDFEIGLYYLQYSFPWTILLVASAVLLIAGKDLRRPEAGLPFLWILCTIAVFLVPATRLKHYSLPSLPAGALIIAEAWRRYGGSRLFNAALYGTAALFCVILAVLAAMFRLTDQASVRALTAAAAAVIVIFIVLLAKKDLMRSLSVFPVAALLLILLGPAFTFEAFPRDAVALVKRNAGPLGVARTQIYLFTYFIERKAVQIFTLEEMNAILDRSGEVIISQANLEKFRRESKARESPWRVLLKWEKWKEIVSGRDIYRALAAPDLSILKEPVYLIRSAGSAAPPPACAP
jgi:4-amino-4-deoxy-L-arabinose transferase-like glycosyltransferase